MKVLGISVKQVVVEMEFTPDDLAKLHWFLDRSTIEYDGENKFEKEAQKYISEKLYPTLVGVLKELENAPG